MRNRSPCTGYRLLVTGYSLLALLLLLVAPVFAAEETYSRPVEIRGVWMDKNSIPKTEKGIRDLIRSYAKAGINLVLPDAIFNGYSSYKSDYLVQKDLYPGIDMLGILIDEAHNNGIEVHPLVCVFRAGYTQDKGGILPLHPNWAMLDKAGKDATENGGYWLSPSIPGVRRLLLNAFVELATKYQVDGIQLDYIRYPSANHDYNPLARDKYKLEKGIDPIDIEPFTREMLDWHLWREEQINSFVREVSQELRWIRPSLQISAAVASFPDQARLNYLQNWEYWAQNTWVDFLSPMDYTSDLVGFMNRLDATTERIRFEALIAPGIGLYVQKDVKPMLDQIQIAHMHPTDGVTLFATAYLTEDRLEALRKGPFRRRAELPFRSPLEKAKVLLNSAGSKLREGIDFGPLVQAQSETESGKKLMDWTSYRKLGMGRSVPSYPPIFIPAEIVPLPEMEIPRVSSAPVIDGKLDDPAWQKTRRIYLVYDNLGGVARQSAAVRLVYDAQNLYIGFDCHEPDVDSLKESVGEPDGPVFNDDSVEVFLQPSEESGDYYHFALNSQGVRYESLVYHLGFNPQWQTAVSKEREYWKAEIAIPFSALEQSAPAAGTFWRANFCRNRVLQMPADQAQNMCWSPTYGSFHTPVRFGMIGFTEEVK